MVKILIADDEKYDRETVKYILREHFADEIKMYEAQNGREAIEVAENIRPNIVIIDIKMPGIDGIKALKEISNRVSSVYGIVLTAYDYFDFAVEAVKINAKAYILKPFEKEEIIEKVMAGIETIRKEQQKRKDEIEDKEKIYTLLPILENQLTDFIISDKLNGIDYNMYLKCLSMSFKNSFSMVISIKNKYSYADSDRTEKDKIKVKVGQYIKEFINRRHKCIGNYMSYEELTYFVQLDNIESDEFKDLEINLAFNLRREVKRRFNISIRVGLGETVDSVEKIIKSYRQSLKCLLYNCSNINIIYIDDIINENFCGNLNQTDSKNPNKVKKELFESVENFIKENIKTNLELETVAKKFGLSVYYFSRTFKEVIGVNFSEYVNTCRIELAKKFLAQGEMTIKEVCYNVGYNDPNYFSKVFKKYEGISPIKYKI